MIYNATVNQFAAYHLGLNKKLDATDLVLFSVIYAIIGSSAFPRIVINNTNYCNICLPLVTSEFPLLKVSNSSFAKRMKKLCNVGLLERYKDTDLFRLGDKAENYYSVTI